MTQTTGSRRSLRQRISGNVAWAFLAEGSAKGAMFLLTIHLASTLGAANFGVFSFVLTIFTFMWMGVDLGLGMYGTREIARRTSASGELLATLGAMRATLALLIAALALGMIALFFRATIPLSLAFAFSGYLLARALYADWFLKGRERYRLLAAVSLAVAAAMLVGGYTLVRDAGDLDVAALPWLFGYGVGAFLLLLALRRDASAASPLAAERIGMWPRHWRESVHFTLSNGVSTIYQNLPLLSLYVLGDAVATGVFAAPFRIVIAGIFVLSILPMAVYPVFADLFERRVDGLPRLIALAAAAVAGAALLVALPVWLFADQVVRALFGAEFDASAPALQILLLFFVLRSVRAVYVRAVCAAGHQRDYSRIAFGAVLALLPMLVATWAFGLPVLAATCWSLVLVEAMTLLAMWRLTGRLLRARVASAA